MKINIFSSLYLNPYILFTRVFQLLMMEISAKLQLQVLEEENSRLRSELLLCQEAAKQAFLRSASALNSEAITMFQVRLNRGSLCQ